MAGCGLLGDPPSLHLAGEDPGTFGSAVPDVPSGRSFTTGAIPLCVTTEEKATITAISPVDGQNLEVIDFATVDGPQQMFGDGTVDLRGAGFDPASKTVTAPCPNDHAELALELRRGSASPGTAEGFLVQFDTASGTGEMVVPFEVRLCPGEVLGYGCASS